MIIISLKDVSIDSVTAEHYSQLRKRFLKDAKKHYSKEAWEDSYLRGLAAIGGGLGVGGTALAYVLDNEWIMIPAMAGVFNMGQALYKKHVAVKSMTDALERRTAELSLQDLAKRVKENDYSIPDPTEDEYNSSLMDMYALKVMYAVAEKDFGILKFPWQAAGAGIAAFGMYEGTKGDAVASGLTLSAGSLVFLIATMAKQRKIANVAKRVSSYLKEKGFQFFDNYVRNKDPYQFYQYKILGKSCQEG